MRLLTIAVVAATLLPHPASAQVQPSSEWRIGADLAAKLKKDAAWIALIDRSTLSVGRYRLKANAKDNQRPHDLDEIYYVVAGKAQFTAAGETRALKQGDVVFVAARAKHHFHDIEEDLDVLVLFSTAVATTGGMAAGPKPTKQTPYAENSARGATRIFYWFGPDSAGQVAIHYGRPRWQAQYGQFLGKPSNKRWRLGENFWTTLDTNMELTVGGVKVPTGQYHMVLQNVPKRGLELVLLDPALVRKQRLDAYEASKTSGGLRIPLSMQVAKVRAGRLAMELTVDRKQRDRGELAITFGSHLLRAEVQMHPDDK